MDDRTVDDDTEQASRAETDSFSPAPTPSAHGYPRARAECYHRRTVADRRLDVDFYAEAAIETEGPVLEMACGTGRIYLPLLDLGIEADGFDRSAAALGVLRDVAADVGLSPTVWQADMTAFAVDRTYDLVVCPFNGFQHLLTVEDQLAALSNAYEVLSPGGRLRLDVFVPRFEYVCDTHGEWQTEAVAYRGASCELRTLTRVVDEVEQILSVRNQLVDPEGELVFDERHRMKMLPKREVELLARQSPFESWTVTRNFSEEPLTDGDTVQVWTFEKARRS
ncbi:MAG: class I SAM-dependent methyltransferase [Haloarculaceae archaeon]